MASVQRVGAWYPWRVNDLKAELLALRHDANQRRIWPAIAISTASLSAMLLRLYWSPRDADPVRLVAYFTLTAVTLGAL